MILMGSRQNAVYSMQTGTDAARKLLDDWHPVIEDSPLAAAIATKGLRRSAGAERIKFKTGSTLEIMRSTKSAGHGRTIDEAIIDEAMHDFDDRREQAVIPAMITRPNAQLVVTSTAGTDESIYWKRKVDHGRERSSDGKVGTSCYFEWSIPDEADPYDEDAWWEFMPALGHTQTIMAIRHAAETMSEGEFRRAFGNQWTGIQETIIDWAKWIECRDTHGEIGQTMVLAVDVTPDRTSGVISAASGRSDGSLDLEQIDREESTGWIVPRLEALRDRHNPMAILVDGMGPAGSMIPEMERCGLPVKVIGGQEFAKACGAFFDLIENRGIHVRPTNSLDEAVAGAAKRIKGDSFTWVRSTLANDISPLVCATLACWGVVGDRENGSLWVY